MAGWVVAAIVGLVLLVATAGVLLRYGLLTPPGLRLLQAQASGLKLGRVGTLRIEGLSGDVWRSFAIARLTIADEKGVWLEADKVRVEWIAAGLFVRRLDVNRVAAERVLIFRRPTLTPETKSAGLPVSIHIGDGQFRLETLEAFSVKRGLFNVGLSLNLPRRGGQRGRVAVMSLMHKGDYLDARFDVRPRHPLNIEVNGVEGEGGALAGALGLPADQPFLVKIMAKGKSAKGRIDAILRTGARTPLRAEGAWTKAGGAVGGRVSLTASTLTAPYAAMVGQEVRFGAAARRAKDGKYGVALKAFSDNVTLAAQGPADFKTRTSKAGIAIDAAVANLSRIVPDPVMGAGHVRGLVKGGVADWRFTGDVRVDKVSAADLTLARVAGPLEMSGRKGEVQLKANLAGAGGTGKGLAAGLVGAAPRAEVTLTRLADGRLLVRSLQATGRAMTLAASGSRGLLGDLNFKGDLRLTDLSLAKPGATGKLQAKWSATQGSAAKPWLFSVEGRGEGLRTGFDELDRLLGAKPRLKLQASLRKGVVSIITARFDGDKAGAGAKGLVGPDGALKLALEWTAKGPFQVGPLEITGDVKGSGALTGTVVAPRADLITDVAAIDVPRLPLKAAHIVLSFAKGPSGVAGQVAITAGSAYGPARARSGFRFAVGGLDLTGLDADAGGVKALGSLSLRGGQPSTADLRLAVGPGAVLSRGEAAGTLRITAGAGPAVAALDLHARDAVVRDSGVWIKTGSISGAGPLARLPLKVAIDGEASGTPFAMNGSGLLAEAGADREFSFNGSGKVRAAPFSTSEPLIFRFGPGGRLVRARLVVAGGRAQLDAREAGGAFNATGAVQGVEMKALNADFTGRIDANLELHGKGERLDGFLDAKLAGARSLDSSPDMALNAAIKAVLADSQVTVDATAAGAEGLRATTHLVLPTEASAAPLHIAIARTRPMSGRFDAEGELKPLWGLFFSGDRDLGGKVQMVGVLSGTLSDPKVVGHASLVDGSFLDAGTGLKLTALNLNAELARDLVTVTKFTAKDGRHGSVTGGGQASLERNGASSFKLNLDKFRVVDNDVLTAIASGEVTVTRGADGKAKVTGTLDVDRAEVNAEAKIHPGVVSMDVVEVNRPLRLQNQLRPVKAGIVALDVRLRAPRHVFVRGRGLNAELSINARVTGSTAVPVLNGSARVIQGDYDFAGKRFQFEERGSISLDTQPENIRLDLSATWTEPSLTATIQIRGTAAKPEITLTSTPGLPQDEILARVLFGTSASQLSSAETAQLASTLGALATGGGFDVLGGLRQIAHLDRLTFGANEIGSATIAGGKYLTDDVYLELVGGGREGPTVEVDWRIKRSFSIVSQVGGQYGAKLAVRWRNDIGRRKRGGRDGAQSPPPKPVAPATN